MDRLDVDGLVPVPADVPARTVPKVGKQRVDTHLGLRVEEHELGFAVLERDGIVGLDLLRPRGIAAEAHGSVIPRVQQRKGHEHDDKRGFHAQHTDYTRVADALAAAPGRRQATSSRPSARCSEFGTNLWILTAAGAFLLQVVACDACCWSPPRR